METWTVEYNRLDAERGSIESDLSQLRVRKEKLENDRKALIASVRAEITKLLKFLVGLNKVKVKI